MSIEQKLQNILTSKEEIREAIENKGVEIEETTPLEDYAEKINEIPQTINNITLAEPQTFTENGTYNPETYNADGFSEITVDVPEPVLETKIIYDRGVYTPEEGVDGFDEIVVSTPEIVDRSATPITENGTYNAPNGTAYSKIVVDIPSTAKEEESLIIDDINTTYYEPQDNKTFSDVSLDLHLQSLTIADDTVIGSTIQPDDGYIGFDEVVINSLPASSDNLMEVKEINSSGTYIASEEYLTDDTGIPIDSEGQQIVDSDGNILEDTGNYVYPYTGYASVVVNAESENIYTETKIITPDSETRIYNANEEPLVNDNGQFVDREGNVLDENDAESFVFPYTGYSSVEVIGIDDMITDEPLIITENGDYNADSENWLTYVDENGVEIPYPAVSNISVNVDSVGDLIHLGTEEEPISANGTYLPEDFEVDGFDQVVIDVSTDKFKIDFDHAYYGYDGVIGEYVQVDVPGASEYAEEQAQRAIGPKTAEITSNGNYFASDDELAGYSSVVVNIPTAETVDLDDLTLPITENGTYNASDFETDGIKSFVVNVPQTIGQIEGDMGELLITKNGTYNATDLGYDGFSSVEIQVPINGGGGSGTVNAGTATITANTNGLKTPAQLGYNFNYFSAINVNISGGGSGGGEDNPPEQLEDLYIEGALANLYYNFTTGIVGQLVQENISRIKTRNITDMSNFCEGGTNKVYYEDKTLDITINCNEENTINCYQFCNNTRIPAIPTVRGLKKILNIKLMFKECYNLKSLNGIFDEVTFVAGEFTDVFYDCWSLDKIENVVLPPNSSSSVKFQSQSFLRCFRIKELTFKSDINFQVDSSSKVLEFDDNTGLGYVQQFNLSNFFDRTTFTSENQVTDDESYNRLKLTTTWFSADKRYSRYNYESAINTLNSLPLSVGSTKPIIRFKIYSTGSKSYRNGNMTPTITGTPAPDTVSGIAVKTDEGGLYLLDDGSTKSNNAIQHAINNNWIVEFN